MRDVDVYAVLTRLKDILMIRSCVLMALACLATVSTGLASASDARVGACGSSARWTFSPPLTQAIQLGTATLTHTVSCAYGGVSTEPPSEYFTLAFGGAPATYTYFGNCVQALLDTVDVTATLLGGTVLVMADSAPIPIASVFTLVPDEPCNVASATGPGVIADLLVH